MLYRDQEGKRKQCYGSQVGHIARDSVWSDSGVALQMSQRPRSQEKGGGKGPRCLSLRLTVDKNGHQVLWERSDLPLGILPSLSVGAISSSCR